MRGILKLCPYCLHNMLSSFAFVNVLLLCLQCREMRIFGSFICNFFNLCSGLINFLILSIFLLLLFLLLIVCVESYCFVVDIISCDLVLLFCILCFLHCLFVALLSSDCLFLISIFDLLIVSVFDVLELLLSEHSSYFESLSDDCVLFFPAGKFLFCV